MSSSDEDQNYQPVQAERGRGAPNTPPPQQQNAGGWPKDGVNVYTNDLFTDGDVLGGGPGGPNNGHYQQDDSSQPSPSGAQRPNSSNRMAAQKSGFAARRQERLAANLYDPNNSPAGPQRLNPNGAGTGLTPRNAPASPSSMYSDSPTRTNAQASSFASSRSDSAAVFSLAPTFDPNADEDEDEGPAPMALVANGGTMPQMRSNLGNPQRAPPPPVEVDMSDLPTFLVMPGPKHGPIQCYIVRDKGGAKMFPRYTLFLEDGKRFLLAARKRKKATTSNYVMSLDYEDLNRESNKFFGKLRSNFVGTEFTIFDNGDKSGQNGAVVDRDAEGAGSVRQELGCVTYQYNVLGTRGPRKMTGVIPKLDPQGASFYRPRTEDDSLLDRVKNHRALGDLMVMHNKPPRWNEELNAYCLNFNGRVTEASVKNFQLITDDNQNHVILQFGKIGRNTFTMDYQWPISALQAFAICLSSFDNKLACE